MQAFLNFYTFSYFTIITRFSAYLLTASLAIAISITFDAVSDPMIGYLSDRFRHPLGRRIPFMLVSVAPTALCLILLFALQLRFHTSHFSQMVLLTVFFR